MKLIFVFFLLLAVAFTDSCGGNCPSGKCHLLLRNHQERSRYRNLVCKT